MSVKRMIPFHIIKQLIGLQSYHKVDDPNIYQVVSYLIGQRLKSILQKQSRMVDKYSEDQELVQQIHKLYIQKSILGLEHIYESTIRQSKTGIPVSFVTKFARTTFFRFDNQTLFSIPCSDLFEFIDHLIPFLKSRNDEESFHLY